MFTIVLGTGCQITPTSLIGLSLIDELHRGHEKTYLSTQSRKLSSWFLGTKSLGIARGDWKGMRISGFNCLAL